MGLGDQTYSSRAMEAQTGTNPLLMEQVQVLETKWKVLRENYDDDGDYSNKDEDIDDKFNVIQRIIKLMGRIEKLESGRTQR